MWILWKMRFQKGEFCKNWDFQYVNFWIKYGFLPQSDVHTYIFGLFRAHQHESENSKDIPKKSPRRKSAIGNCWCLSFLKDTHRQKFKEALVAKLKSKKNPSRWKLTLLNKLKLRRYKLQVLGRFIYKVFTIGLYSLFIFLGPQQQPLQSPLALRKMWPIIRLRNLCLHLTFRISQIWLLKETWKILPKIMRHLLWQVLLPSRWRIKTLFFSHFCRWRSWQSVYHSRRRICLPTSSTCAST